MVNFEGMDLVIVWKSAPKDQTLSVAKCTSYVNAAFKACSLMTTFLLHCNASVFYNHMNSLPLQTSASMSAMSFGMVASAQIRIRPPYSYLKTLLLAPLDTCYLTLTCSSITPTPCARVFCDSGDRIHFGSNDRITIHARNMLHILQKKTEKRCLFTLNCYSIWREETVTLTIFFSYLDIWKKL